MYYGSAWYPEHWPEARWPEDLRLMREAGMNVARVAEFAWSRLQPAENRFDLDWLARAVDLAQQAGLQIVIGTPTAAPPAWLTQAFPEVLAVGEDGRRALHGGRCHYNPVSPRYREFCRAIADALGRRFGDHPNVIGWQIDNEYWRVSYDSQTCQEFQDWLRARYQSLEALNAAWSTAYWSQEYSDWSQIPFSTAWQNPGLVLALRRFMTEVYRQYQKVQIDALRAVVAPRQWITHNIHAHENLDWRLLAQDLDLVSYDPYVGSGHLDYKTFGWVSDFWRTAPAPGNAGLEAKPTTKARGQASPTAARPGHWIIECQPGRVNWHQVNNELDKGATRAMAWHFVGHGAEAVLFWQWRSALGGQEQYHGCLVAPDGQPRPFYHEAARIGRDFAAAGAAIAGTTVQARIALLHSYPDRWAVNYQRHHKDFDPIRHLTAWYGPLRAMGLDIDILDPREAVLEGYALVAAPSLHLLSPQVAGKLAAYVRGGGHLMLGPRSGMKDEHNALLPSRQPGAELAEMLGAHVEEFYALDQPVGVKAPFGQGQATLWAEYLRLDSPEAQVLLTYNPGNGWLDEQPGLVTRAVDAGHITYLGAWLDEALMRQVLTWAVKHSNVTPAIEIVPEGVEVCRRTGGGREVLILINHSTKPHKLVLPRSMKPVLTPPGTPAAGHLTSIDLPPREVAVLVHAEADRKGRRGARA